MNDFPALPYPWQQAVWQRLLQQHSDGRLPHALMLAGPRGLGKRHLAQALGQYLLCHGPVGEAACGKCKSCQLNRAGTHPDFMQVSPEDTGKAIRVDDIRALAEIQGKTAQMSGYKVAIVCPADAMNNNAANALLKTLEEPAAKTLLILVTDVPGSVLPTVRSRCQLLTLTLPAREQSLRWLTPLVSGTGIESDELLDIARGAPLAARDLLNGDALEERHQWQADMAKLCLGQADALQIASRWHTGDVATLFDWLISWLHLVACWRAGAACVSIDKLDQPFRAQLAVLDTALLQRYLEKLLTAKKLNLSGANPNKQLLIEELLLDWEALLRASRAAAKRAG
ncbi:MAG TPA: DNA polymerase III subunit delta' [Cellvibrionaceae bacterium]